MSEQPRPGADQSELLVRLTKIDGNVENLRTLINAGDQHTQQLIELQKGEVRHLSQMQAEDRQRHHDEMAALRLDLVRAIEKGDLGLSVVRADSKTYIDEHVQRLAAQDTRLTSRVGKQDERIDHLENALNRFKGAAWVLGVLVPVLTALLTAIVLKGLGLK